MAKYKNVTEMFQDSKMNAETRSEVLETLSSQRLVNRLAAMRVSAGLSQAKIAERMNCSQGRISKLEHGKDEDLTLGEIRQYAEAVQCEFTSALVPRDVKPVDKAKMLAFGIHRYMKDMAQLAHRDEDVAKEVAKFFGEVFFNMSRLIGDAAGELPTKEDGTPLM